MDIGVLLPKRKIVFRSRLKMTQFSFRVTIVSECVCALAFQLSFTLALVPCKVYVFSSISKPSHPNHWEHVLLIQFRGGGGRRADKHKKHSLYLVLPSVVVLEVFVFLLVKSYLYVIRLLKSKNKIQIKILLICITT